MVVLVPVVLHLPQLVVPVDDLAEEAVLAGAVEAAHNQEQHQDGERDRVGTDHLLQKGMWYLTNNYKTV